MPKIISEEVAFESKWMQVVVATIEAEDGRQTPYFYHRYPWSNSLGVAILCYRDVVSEFGYGNTRREYLGRYEYLPAQGEGVRLCSITGGYDKEGENFHECAIRELEEEGGYTTTVGHLQALGIARNSKSSDNVMHLFAVNVKHCTPVEAIGDGTIGEECSYSNWVSETEAMFCDDVLVPTMICRLKALS
jgi:ADP-ribose pyrophosphatase YjhB (NUDIX family)